MQSKPLKYAVVLVVGLLCFWVNWRSFVGRSSEYYYASHYRDLQLLFFQDAPILYDFDEAVNVEVFYNLGNDNETWQDYTAYLEKLRWYNSSHWERQLKLLLSDGLLASFGGGGVDKSVFKGTQGFYQLMRLSKGLIEGNEQVFFRFVVTDELGNQKTIDLDPVDLSILRENG